MSFQNRASERSRAKFGSSSMLCRSAAAAAGCAARRVANRAAGSLVSTVLSIALCITPPVMSAAIESPISGRTDAVPVARNASSHIAR